MAEIQGGDFKDGFLSAGFSVLAGAAVFGENQGFSVERVALQAVVGGTASVIGGGKFANGAYSAAFIYVFNESGNNRQRGYEATEYDDGTVCNAGTYTPCIVEGAQSTWSPFDFISGGGFITRFAFRILGREAAELVVKGGAQNAANASRLAKQLTDESARSPFTKGGQLTEDAISTSKPVPNLGPGQLSNSAVPQGFGKYTTQPFQSPSGNFQVHFYMNPTTRSVYYDLDYKSVFNEMSGIHP